MSSSRISEDEINDIVCKLQALLPYSSSSSRTRVPASKVLKETCNYIRRLQVEVDNLAERLSRILESTDANSIDAADILRSLLRQ